MREAAEMSIPTSDYFAAPLDDNLFEWHFTVRGPEDTEFQVTQVLIILKGENPNVICIINQSYIWTFPPVLERAQKWFSIQFIDICWCMCHATCIYFTRVEFTMGESLCQQSIQ